MRTLLTLWMTRVDLLVAEVILVLQDGLAEVVRPNSGRRSTAPAQQPLPQSWARRDMMRTPGLAVVRARRAVVWAGQAMVRAGFVAVGMHVLQVREGRV